MPKTEIEFYAVIADRRTDWDRKYGHAPKLTVTHIRQNKPRLSRDEIAVKIRLAIDVALFEEFVPTVTAEIQAPHIHVPAAEIELEEPDDDDQALAEALIDPDIGAH
jgi:hypothetical protein